MHTLDTQVYLLSTSFWHISPIADTALTLHENNCFVYTVEKNQQL